MRPLTADPVGLWTHRIAIAFFVVLTCAVIAPGGAFWTAAVGAGLAGSIAATVLVVRSRRVPSLAQVIEDAEREPAARPGERSEP